MKRTILVPLDGSSLSERALPYAQAIATACEGRLQLVRALSPQALPGGEVTTEEIVSAEEAAAALAEQAEALRSQCRGLEVDYHLYYDEPAAAIGDAARWQHAALVVMATHGRGGLDRWIRGSVADRVLHQTDAPLLLVPANCTRAWPADRPPRILVPLDGTSLAEEGLAWAETLARGMGAEIVLLTAIEPPRPLVPDAAAQWRPGDPQSLVDAAEAYLEATAAGLRVDGRAVTTLVRAGTAVSTIVEVVREAVVDAVIMATRGRSGVARLILGSVATGVLQRAAVPLLLVRSSGVREPVAERTVEPRARAPLILSLAPAEIEVARLALRDFIRGSFQQQHPDATAVVPIAAELLARLDSAARAAVPGSAPRASAPPA